ncbi:enoyl-ACP reductase FabI [Streptomyces niger]|uniref:enoyl-ACP reductase FabI n=1 Tax=Streptomyces niger TaxID=66373 RepID=UPI00069C3093|nr:enoyl-ACP reductase FabI [Streptomyces niger]
MQQLLHGKKILVTGVLTDTSIGFHVARVAQELGARVILTAHPRPRMTRLFAQRLPSGPDDPPPVIELDVTDAGHLARLAEQVAEHVDGLDGVVHAIGYAPPAALGGNFLTTEWPDAATALQVSAYSLQSLTMACRPLMKDGGSVVGLTFDASRAWPAYDWMGVAKAALESCARYLSRYLGPEGIRVNLVAAGPLATTAARSIPGFDGLTAQWPATAPLGWDVRNPEPAALACAALMSDCFPATTGEIVHVDGGLHAVGAPPAAPVAPPHAT